MKNAFGLSISIFISALALVGCSPVAFTPCESFGEQACEVSASGTRFFDNQVTVPSPQADILFVNDNSPSMSTEQQKMGEKFPNFISSISGIDYNIAIITTDVSASPNNPPDSANDNGALQDGNFIEFGNGAKVLTSAASNIMQLFDSAIRRPETLDCDSSGFDPDFCPSPDERAIFAANLAVSRGDTSFFRSDSHLAIVILSDEDERSKSGEITGFGLESNDQPQSLIDNVRNQFGSDKSFSVHSIIVEPGDTFCINQQNAQPNGVKGFEGKIYRDLSVLTNGTVGSICASDYGQELGEIGSNIVEKVNSVSLACRPINDEVAVAVSPDVPDLIITLDVEAPAVRFNQNLPAGTTVRVTYECPQ